MSAATLNLETEQGATLRFSLVWQYETAPGSDIFLPYDLSGCTARLKVRINYTTPVIFSITDTGVDEIQLEPGAVQGKISIHFSAANTDLITVKKAKYDLEIVFPSGDVKRACEGAIANDLAVTSDLP
jgi:hypothetical protein